MGALLTNKELYYFDLIEGELSCEEAAGREVSRRERTKSALDALPPWRHSISGNDAATLRELSPICTNACVQ